MAVSSLRFCVKHLYLRSPLTYRLASGFEHKVLRVSLITNFTSTVVMPCSVAANITCHSQAQCSHTLNSRRGYAKRKKPVVDEHEEEDEEEEEEEEEEETFTEDVDGSRIASKTVASLRLDSILKAGLSLTKKKIERQLYLSNIRVNGETAVKKGYTVQIGDEIDLVKGYSADSERLLDVSRVILKSVGKVTGAGNIPVKVQVFKSLIIENYENKWTPSEY